MENLPNKGLISLKEAAKISGYTSDYVGQLIRAGKIPGKQVYSNIAWMTTAKAVLEYKNKSSNTKQTVKDLAKNKYRLLAMEFNMISLFFRTFKTALPLLLLIIVSFIVLFVFIIFQLSDNNPGSYNQSPNTEVPSITF